VNVNAPRRRVFFFANVAWIRQKTDADGAFSLPADSYDLTAEWGPASGVPSYVASSMVSAPVWRNIRLSVSAMMQGGVPYNLTTGRDDNADTVFNDRPAGVGRNSSRGKGAWDAGARLSYTFGFGERDPAAGPAGPGPVVIVHRAGPGVDSGGMLGALGGSGADNNRIRIELFVTAQNLFNHTNPIGYSGVMTSPFFGQPTAAMPGRRVELGARIAF
jgi:hypothetical protein